MEYLEGETLADRLTKGALPLDQALTIAIQIADALDQGASRGHRASRFEARQHHADEAERAARRSPQAKLLDFGLAKTSAPAVAGAGLSMLPTTPPGLTAQGTILGTFQYMAPEQLEGQEADARTDIFAFGAVLYEMLTGKKAFEGKSHASLISAIMSVRAEASLRAAAAYASCARPHRRHVPGQRSRRPVSERARPVTRPHMGGIRIERERRGTDGDTASPIEPCRVAGRRSVNHRTDRRRRSSPCAAPARSRPQPARRSSRSRRRRTRRLEVLRVEALASPHRWRCLLMAGTSCSSPAPNPLYQIWLRPVAALAARPIPGTEGGTFPFWSPDSRFIGFFAGGKLKKVADRRRTTDRAV